MAVTRIKNNQITDNTITYTKIAPGTLVGSNFNSNITLNSNVSIIGNLTVTGSTSSVNSTNTYVNDPLVVFNNGYTGSLSGYDIGILVNRNLSALSGYGSVNTAWVWVEADSAFEALTTTDTGGGITSINNSGFANVKLGNLTAYSLSISGGQIFGTISTANVSLYEQVTATTTNATFYPMFTDRSTTGNSAAYVDSALNFNPSTNNLTTTTFTGAFSGTASITSGSITGTTGAFTTLTATNFSAANAVTITGASIGTAVATNLSSGNAVITGGSITGGTGAFTTLTATNFSAANAVTITGASITTATVANFTSANAHITGSDTNIGANHDNSVNRINLIYSTTENATNFSSGNVLITGGSITGITGSASTLVATNFSSGNIVVTGGSINNTTVGATTATTGRFTTIVGTDATNATSTTTGAVQIAGGVGVTKDVWIGGNLYVSNVFSTTYSSLSVNDPLLYLTANAIYPYNYDIGTFSQFRGGTGNNYQHTGFVRSSANNYWGLFSNVITEPTTTINWSDSNLVWDTLKMGAAVLANTTAASSTTTGALQVAGGAGIAGALYVGGQLYAAGINGTATTANVSLYEQVTATTTNATFYPMFTDRSTTGNSAAYVDSALNFNPSTNNLTTTTFTGTFSGTASITSGSITGTTGAFTTLTASNFSTANAVITGGSTGTFTNVTATNFSTANAVITGGSLNNSPIGASTRNTGAFTTLTANSNFYVSDTDNATSANTGAAVILGGVGIGGSLYNQGIHVSTGNIVAANTAESTSTVTGALVSAGGLGVASNVNIGKSVLINTTQTSGADFKVLGASSTNLLWAKPGSYDQVMIGNSASLATMVTGAKLQINSTDSILVPVGTSAQRPGSSGGTDTTGMFRYNTTINALEYYGGGTPGWQAITSQFTVIADQQANGDGTTTIFTLTESQTTNSCIVSINGVIQIPTLAYSVSGTTLTFTEAPASGDVIDIRKLTTTVTVTNITSQNGYNTFEVDNTGAYIKTGTASPVTSVFIDTNGVINVSDHIIPTSNASVNLGNASSWFGTFYGISSQAKYADLAENYQADSAYAPGTVVEFGGEAEVTLGTPDTKRVAGVVSTNPAHLMNGGLTGPTVVPLALQGRVPCNVIGPVQKGDLMVSAGFGYAKPNNNAQIGQVIGKALADFTGAKGQVEVVVGRV